MDVGVSVCGCVCLSVCLCTRQRVNGWFDFPRFGRKVHLNTFPADFVKRESRIRETGTGNEKRELVETHP